MERRYVADQNQFKDLMLAFPNPDHTRQECQDYLIKNHAFTAMNVQETRDVFIRYTGNSILTLKEIDVETLYAREHTPHLVIEHVTISRDAYMRSFDNEEYLEKVRPDETYMVTEFQGGMPQFYSVEEYITYTDENRATGQYRIFDFIQKKEDVSQKDFIAVLVEESKSMSENTDFQRIAHARIVDIVLNIDPLFGDLGSYDAVIETIVDDPAALEQYYQITRDTLDSFVDADASVSMITRQCVVK